MAYKSIDTIQKLLSDDVFHYTKDRKKAAGRALGTFVEIIAYYLIKQWGLDIYTAIERPLQEFANSDITHNVEFSLHPLVRKDHIPATAFDSFTSKSLIKIFQIDGIIAKSGNLIDRNSILKNAFTFAKCDDTFFNAYLHGQNIEITELQSQPIAMIECKRVGVEEGMTKGPQTIEKAKQGSYVARTVSSLQRFRNTDGRIMGVLPTDTATPIIDEYYTVLENILNGVLPIPTNFILTIGVVSNHGNWFTATNMNKELRVLANSFDWLLFLTDFGLAQFVEDLLLNPKVKYLKVREAFINTYSQGTGIRAFTKSRISREADMLIQDYFATNIDTIENNWFEALSPNGKSISDLKIALQTLLNNDCRKTH